MLAVSIKIFWTAKEKYNWTAEITKKPWDGYGSQTGFSESRVGFINNSNSDRKENMPRIGQTLQRQT